MDVTIECVELSFGKQPAQMIKGPALAQPNLKNYARYFYNELRSVIQASPLRHQPLDHALEPVRIGIAVVCHRFS
jgi:hypothetical protein